MTYQELLDTICAYTQNYEQDFVANIPVFVKQAEQRIYNTIQFPSLRKNVTGSTSAANKYLSCPGDFLSVYSMAVIDGDGAYEFLLNKDVNFIRQAYPNPASTGLPKYYAIFGPTVSGTTITDELTFILGPTPDDAYSVELHYYYYPETIARAGIVQGRLSFPSTVYSYVVGSYEGVSATGGSGTGLTVDITITDPTGTPAIAAITATDGGQDYVVGDTVLVDLAALTGGADTGTLPLTVLTTTSGTTWLGDNFDSVLLYGALVEAITFMKGEDDMVKLYNAKYAEALGMAKRLGDGLERGDAYRDGQYKQRVT